MLNLKITPLLLVSIASLACAGLAAASLTMGEITADLHNIPQADDIIPMEEMADEAMMDADSSDMDDVRSITTREKATFAQKRVQLIVYKSTKETGRQHMDVMVDGKLLHQFTVSTAFERKVTGASGRTYFSSTPNGQFVPDGMQERRYSNLWKTWLKYVIRFSGGVWIHATTPDHYKELGAPASGGCVRVHEDDAEQIYKIVSSYGIQETAITIVPAPGEPQVKPAKAPGRLVQ